MNAAAVRAVLARHGLSARRDLGQNFLIDEAMAGRLVRLAGVEAGETVIEIGAGLGTLTRALAARAARVVAIEIDAGLVRALRAEKLLPDNVDLLHADALAIDLAALAAGPARLVGNLPYSVASPLLRRLLDLRGVLTDWSVMLQREVAARVVAAAGSRDYGSLAVLHALTARVEKCAELAPGLFHPMPRVRSSFLRITPLAAPRLAGGELAVVERIVRGAFSKRRKTLANALRGAKLAPEGGPQALEALLRRLGIDPRARAESLAPELLLGLARALAPDAGGGEGRLALELSELLARLADLAREAGLEVRELRAAGEGLGSPASGVCRVRDKTWVVLAASDDLEERIEVLAQALKTHAAHLLESRYLPPAVRARLARQPDLG